MSKKIEITSKHIEQLIGRNVNLSFIIAGNFKGRFYGKIVGRLRNRFKQYVFAPETPFIYFQFAVDDVEKIEMPDDDTWLITMKENKPEPKKRRRKKKKPLSVAAVETETAPVVDLTGHPHRLTFYKCLI